MSDVVYQNLSIDLKNEILLNSYINQKLKLGYYSKVYKIKINDKIHSYRFHSTLDNNEKKINMIVFDGKVQKHKPFKKNNQIYFHDKELQKTLKINKDLFEEEVINMGFSDEQKELLSEGKDVTLEVISTTKTNKQVILSNSIVKKSFVADYSFFLGSNTLFVKESIKVNSIKMVINS